MTRITLTPMVTASRVRQLLSALGDIRPQPATEWKGDFPLPRAVEHFYRDVGPLDIEIPGTGNPILLPSLSRLWDLQAGYRWNGNTGERIADWEDDWLVVGYEGGDPYVLSRSSGRISQAIHGTGEWDPSEVFEDLDHMACSLAILGSIVAEVGHALYDEDFQIRPEYRVLARQRLAEIYPAEEARNVVLAALSWT